MIGQSIAHYRVTAKLGEGGMGEVYRATDTKLHREVAIKVLPPSLAGDPDRRARFEREAQVLAALNHPNIAAIYGVEEHALIMELVEGPTLADRIKEGPIPVDEAIPIARQIAEALAAAHDKGIIHRDLKPANVKVTPDGQVKVLDFGLAKAMEATPAAGGNPSTSPTITMGPSVAGMILGTAGYMSPEQARGGQLDKRSDIWSFGVVLWEMVTGKTLFVGESISDTLAAVLKTDPDWTSLPANTPTYLQHMLRRCLERDRKQRLRDISLFLEEPQEAAAPPPKRRWVAWALAALCAAAAVTLALRPTPPAYSRHFVITPDALNELDYGRSAVISPDGKQIAYVAGGKLWLRDMDRVEATAVDTSDGAEAPFWSADSSLIAFVAHNELRRVPRSGGKPSPICRVGPFRGGAFRPDGSGVVYSDSVLGVLEVAAGGGDPRVVVDRAKVGATLYAPIFVPGSNTHLIVGKGRIAAQQLVLLSIEDGQQEVLVDGSFPSYASSGHILFQPLPTRAGIWALPFSPRSGKATGAAFRISAEGLHPSVGADGSLVYRDAENAMRRLVIRDRTGNMSGVPSEPQDNMGSASVSPDGMRVAVSAEEERSVDVWIHEPARQSKMRLTFGPETNGRPVWISNDVIAHGTTRNAGPVSTVARKADGSGPPMPVGPGFPLSWSASQKVLLLSRAGTLTRDDIWMARRRPDGTFESSVPVLTSASDEHLGRISPDGRFIAYSSDETARHEIYVRPFPSGVGKWQVSSRGGFNPVWSPSTNELFFVDTSGDLFSAEVSTRSGFQLGPPKLLFRAPGIRFRSSLTRHDVFPDGKRFVFVEPVGESKPIRIHVLENWFERFRK